MVDGRVQCRLLTRPALPCPLLPSFRRPSSNAPVSASSVVTERVGPPSSCPLRSTLLNNEQAP